MSARAWGYCLLAGTLIWLLIAGAGRALWLLLGGWWILLAPFIVVLGLALAVVCIAWMVTAWSRRPHALRPLLSDETQRRRSSLHEHAWGRR
jgi:hypothetical protein